MASAGQDTSKKGDERFAASPHHCTTRAITGSVGGSSGIYDMHSADDERERGSLMGMVGVAGAGSM